jgi:hypothetical protein
MLRFALPGAVATVLTASVALAQGGEMPVQFVNVPGTDYQIAIGGSDAAPLSQGLNAALLRAIAAWLHADFDLPQVTDLPNIAFAPSKTMVALRYQDVPSDRMTVSGAASDAPPPEIIALYSDEGRTIYLPNDWSGRSPADLSVVVHEMVHHVQNVAGLKYACPEAREAPAYDAQEQWLALFGTDLEHALGLDPMTVLVRTHCFY